MLDTREPQAALIVAFSFTQKEPIGHTILSNWSNQGIKITGVRALSMMYGDKNFIAVLETDQDSIKVVLAYY